MDGSNSDRRDRYVRGQVTREQNVNSRDFSEDRYGGIISDENEDNYDESGEQEYNHENQNRRNVEKRCIVGHLERVDTDDDINRRFNEWNNGNSKNYSSDEVNERFDDSYDSNKSFSKSFVDDVEGDSDNLTGRGPDVVITMADVHLTANELEDLDKLESYPNQYKKNHHSNSITDREGRSRSHDKKKDRYQNDPYEGQGHLKKEARKSQSQQNLNSSNQDFRPKARHHYTPNLVRKGKDYSYELPVDIALEDEEGENYDYYGDMVKIPKATSVADVSKVAQFQMPASKMGSFQDFGPIKHSSSTLRVSSSKGN